MGHLLIQDIKIWVLATPLIFMPPWYFLLWPEPLPPFRVINYKKELYKGSDKYIIID